MRAWAVRDFRSVLPYSIRRTRIQAMAAFVEATNGIPAMGDQNSLTNDQREAWGKWRAKGVRSVRVEITEITEEEGKCPDQ